MTDLSPIQTTFAAPAQGAKWSFVTRRVCRDEAVRLTPDTQSVKPGDLVLAEVGRIGNHKRLQLADGRFSPLWPGDRIVVACGDRFAADQFEGDARFEENRADLLAGGGVAGISVSKHDRIGRPTGITVLGCLAGPEGRTINLSDFALEKKASGQPDLTFLVLGSGMNAGKTAAAAGIVNGFARRKQRVAAIKATGTGAFGDLQEYEAAGAARVLDFVDAGMASTYRQPLPRVDAAINTLLAHAADCDVAVVELADGVSQVETAALLAQPGWAARFDAVILAAPDAMAARGALSWLEAHNIVPLALSGLLTRAPICKAEAAETGLPVFDRSELGDPATATALTNMIETIKRSAA
jgi:hypothetical protein